MSTDSVVSRRLAGREGKAKSRTSIYFTENDEEFGLM